LIWLILIEEYGVTFKHLPGKKQKNFVVDALSLLDIHRLKIKGEKRRSTKTSLRIRKQKHQKYQIPRTRKSQLIRA
jgi:hypothetical protein